MQKFDKKEIKLLIYFTLPLFLDQLIKLSIVKYRFFYTSSYIIIKKVENHGISFGALADSSPLLRIIIFSTFYGFIAFFAYVIVFYILNKAELYKIRVAIIFLLTGITGNALDRIYQGFVTDYFIINTKFSNHLVFNLTDVVQVVGGAFTIYYLFKMSEKIWYLNNIRSFKILDKKFQLAFAIKLSMISFFTAIILSIYSLSILLTVIPPSPMKDNAVKLFLIGTSSISILLFIISFCFGLMLSHRTSGPIYALQTFIKDLTNQTYRPFKTREQDYHKQIEGMAKQIRNLAEKRNSDAK